MKGSEAADSDPNAKPSEALLVLTTVAASYDAEALARTLVEQRLAACVNILPGIRSVYRWKDSIEVDSEQLLIIKTARERLEELRATIRELHPYEVPEFVVIGINQLSEEYRSWLLASVTR